MTFKECLRRWLGEEATTDCEGKLATCTGQLAKSNEAYDKVTEENVRLNTTNTQLIGQLAALNMLKMGPVPPSENKLRVINGAQLNDLLFAKLGQIYASAPHFFSDDIYQITTAPETDRYLRFYEKNWLPILNPYTVLEWRMLNGQVVKIYIRDCDDFADHFQGVASTYLGWSGIAWGNIWAVVNGLFLSGGHAFNFVPTYREEYNEVGINGLDLWLIESQTSGAWTVNGKRGDTTAIVEYYERKPLEVMALYNLESVMMVKD